MIIKRKSISFFFPLPRRSIDRWRWKRREFRRATGSCRPSRRRRRAAAGVCHWADIWAIWAAASGTSWSLWIRQSSAADSPRQWVSWSWYKNGRMRRKIECNKKRSRKTNSKSFCFSLSSWFFQVNTVICQAVCTLMRTCTAVGTRVEWAHWGRLGDSKGGSGRQADSAVPVCRTHSHII